MDHELPETIEGLGPRELPFVVGSKLIVSRNFTEHNMVPNCSREQLEGLLQEIDKATKDFNRSFGLTGTWQEVVQTSGSER